MSNKETVTSLNIGIFGASGVGKSSLINALRRLKPSDPGYVASDVVHTTTQPSAYDYPRNPTLKLWELPALGSTELPRRRYLDQIQLKRYDFFLIVCCSRFKEDDLWFAQEIRNANKRFYFVRTKVDIDIRSNQEDYPETHNEESVKMKIKADYISILTQSGFTNQSVFLVCKNPMMYDFCMLEEALINEVQQLKSEAEQVKPLASETRKANETPYRCIVQ